MRRPMQMSPLAGVAPTPPVEFDCRLHRSDKERKAARRAIDKNGAFKLSKTRRKTTIAEKIALS